MLTNTWLASELIKCGSRAIVPKLGVNYHPRVICDSSMGNAKPKSQCCLVSWVITAKVIFDLKCEKFVLRVIDRIATLIWVTVRISLGTTVLELLINFKSETPKLGVLSASLKGGWRKRLHCSLPLISTPDYMYGIYSVQRSHYSANGDQLQWRTVTFWTWDGRMKKRAPLDKTSWTAWF